MYKTCSVCGIVDMNHDCPYRKTKQIKKNTNAKNFRSKNVWTKKSKSIRERDLYLCQACKAKMKGTVYQFNSTKLEVHHIVPVEEDESKALDDDNLITLCSLHHHMADNGDITREALSKLIPPIN